MNRIWATTAIALLALTGCAAAPSSEEPTSTASSGSAAVESICQDAAANGAMGVDLKQARLHSDGSELLVEYTLSDALPARGVVHLFIMARSAAGDTRYMLGTDFKDGKETSHFAYNLASSTPKDLTQDADMADRTVTVRYPIAELEGLGEGFEWDARASVGDKGVDRCPAGDDPKWNVHTNS